MAAFAGYVRCDGGPVPTAMFEHLRRGLGAQREVASWRGESADLAAGPATQRPDPFVRAQPIELKDGSVLLADIRLDDRAGLRAVLAPDAARGEVDDAALAALAVERWGHKAYDRLFGDVAIVRWDPRRRQLTLAVDAIGTRPLYYTVLPNGAVAFAGVLRVLVALPEVSRDLDEQNLASMLTTLPAGDEQTLYRAIRRVPPGGIVTIDRHGVKVARYWSAASIAPVRFSRDADYVSLGRALLAEAVASRLSVTGATGVSLSGGFGSTGIAATAALLLGKDRLSAFTRVPGVEGVSNRLDGRGLAEATAARYGNIDWSVIDDDAPVLRDSAPESEAPLLGIPRYAAFGASWFEPLYQAADQAGVAVLLNGAMDNTTLSWTPGNGAPPTFIDRARRWTAALFGRGTPRGDDAQRFAWDRIVPVSRDFLDALDFDAQMAASAPASASVEENVREKRLRFIRQQRPRDIWAKSRRQWGFEQVDPFTDRRMIEFTLGIPADQYSRNGVDRWLAKRVLADRVPAKVLKATAKGVKQPEWLHVASRNRAAMIEQVERIAQSPTASRVLDIDRMRALLAAWPDDAQREDHDAKLRMIVLQRGIDIGSFLRWHEGGDDAHGQQNSMPSSAT